MIVNNKNGDKLYRDPITGKEYLLLLCADFQMKTNYDICVVMEDDGVEGNGYGETIGYFMGATLGDDWLDECTSSLLAEKHISAQIGKPTAFYTGGGIWLSAMYTDATHYAVVDSEDTDCMTIYDHSGEDEDDLYPCQNMTESKAIGELNNKEQEIYKALLRTLRKEMH